MTRLVDIRVMEAKAAAQALARDVPVFRRRDLLAAGITDSMQSAMYRRGVIARLRHGVYVLTEHMTDLSPAEVHRVHVAAAIAAADEPTWAVACSAAVVHGLPLPFDAPDQVQLLRRSRQDERSLTRPSRHRLVVPSTCVTTHSLADQDVTSVRGIAVVSRPVAAVTAARDLTRRWRVALMDAVLWNSAVSHDDLSRVNEDWRSRGGKAQVDEAIALSRRGAQTVLETFSRLALMEHGLPEPQLQAAFHDRDGLIGYVDMWWPELGVVGEADGRVKYAAQVDLVNEKVREDRLRALGLGVVRWMWEDISHRPAEVAHRIREAAARSSRGGGSVRYESGEAGTNRRN